MVPSNGRFAASTVDGVRIFFFAFKQKKDQRNTELKVASQIILILPQLVGMKKAYV